MKTNPHALLPTIHLTDRAMVSGLPPSCLETVSRSLPSTTHRLIAHHVSSLRLPACPVHGPLLLSLVQHHVNTSPFHVDAMARTLTAVYNVCPALQGLKLWQTTSVGLAEMRFWNKMT